MMKGQRHLSDDRLIEVCLESAPGHGELQHLDSCIECQGRRAGIARMLDEISQAAAAEADEVFPLERLTRQHARILQRIEHEGRPGRVIAFPAGHASGPFVLRTRPAMRWIAGAAAAGLVIGLLAGHLAHDFSVIRPARATQLAVAIGPAPAVPTLQAIATNFSEDDFLGQIDRAIEGLGSTSLRPLDELTPRAWEATIP